MGLVEKKKEPKKHKNLIQPVRKTTIAVHLFRIRTAITITHSTSLSVNKKKENMDNQRGAEKPRRPAHPDRGTRSLPKGTRRALGGPSEVSVH